MLSEAKSNIIRSIQTHTLRYENIVVNAIEFVSAVCIAKAVFNKCCAKNLTIVGISCFIVGISTKCVVRNSFLCKS